MTKMTPLMAALLRASHQNLHVCLDPQCLARIVTRSSGARRPPSLLLVELPVLLGPSTGPNPWERTLLFIGIIFHPQVPAFAQRILLEATVSRFRDLNALHKCISVDSCWWSYKRWWCYRGMDSMCCWGVGWWKALSVSNAAFWIESPKGCFHLLEYLRKFNDIYLRHNCSWDADGGPWR